MRVTACRKFATTEAVLLSVRWSSASQAVLKGLPSVQFDLVPPGMPMGIVVPG